MAFLHVLFFLYVDLMLVFYRADHLPHQIDVYTSIIKVLEPLPIKPRTSLCYGICGIMLAKHVLAPLSIADYWLSMCCSTVTVIQSLYIQSFWNPSCSKFLNYMNHFW